MDHPASPMEIGRVAGLWRYPVKSMAGEPLSEVEVGWHGLVGDRRWAFVRPGQERNGFPWLTLRDSAALAGVQTRFDDPAHPDASAVFARTPDGLERDVADPALAAALSDGARVIRIGRGAFDTLPLSLLTRQTLAGLEALVERELAVARFRPNLLVDSPGGGAFPEDGWVGATLRIGGMRMRVDKRDQRCVVVNVDPATGARDPAVLRAIGRERQACLGVYGSVVACGAVAVGDPVVLER